MLVYRVANTTSVKAIPEGPYRSPYTHSVVVEPDWDDDEFWNAELSPYEQMLNAAHSDLLEAHNDDPKNHPVADRDGLPSPYSLDDDQYFAFLTMERLLQWFEGWIDDLYLTHFAVFVYYVQLRDVLIGKSGQVVARLSPEKLVEVRPLIQL